MDNGIKSVVSRNLIELRKAKGMTQSDLAGMLNYSDKTVSKWENGDSLPDISVLAALAEIYGITLDDLIRENAAEKTGGEAEADRKRVRTNNLVILCLTVSVVFLVAGLVFVYLNLKADVEYWLVFIWAIPVSCLMLLYCGRRMNRADKKWTNWRIYRMAVLSVLCWSSLIAFYLQFLKYQLWLVFIVGIPVELIIWFGSKLSR